MNADSIARLLWFGTSAAACICLCVAMGFFFGAGVGWLLGSGMFLMFTLSLGREIREDERRANRE